TVVRKGEVRHGDSLGHRGAIGAGDIQWMTSGSGIMHEEMPQVRPEGIAGLQLWLNLPARDKMSRPKYRDLQADGLPPATTDEGAEVRVIAGEAMGGRLTGPVGGLAVAPKFVDVVLRPGTTFRDVVPRGHTAFAYVDAGAVRFGAERRTVHAPSLVVFGEGDLVQPEGADEAVLPDRREDHAIGQDALDLVQQLLALLAVHLLQLLREQRLDFRQAAVGARAAARGVGLDTRGGVAGGAGGADEHVADFPLAPGREQR